MPIPNLTGKTVYCKYGNTKTALVLRKQSNIGYIVQFETTCTNQDFKTLEINSYTATRQCYIRKEDIKISHCGKWYDIAGKEVEV